MNGAVHRLEPLKGLGGRNLDSTKLLCERGMTLTCEGAVFAGSRGSGCPAGSCYEKCVRNLGTGTRFGDVQICIPSGALSVGVTLRGVPRVFWEVQMNIWTEFKNTILPWLLASAVVAFLVAEHRRTTGALLEANNRLANAVEQQGKALDGVRALLASQGYTLPPLAKP